MTAESDNPRPTGDPPHDAASRVLLAELGTTQRALVQVMRELERIRATGEHTEAVLAATRQELATTRAMIHNQKAKAEGLTPITQLVHRIAYHEPKAKTIAMDKAASDGAMRIFVNDKELLGGKIAHIVRGKDANGFVVQLPCSYDLAHRWLSMEQPNRRRHWRGNRMIYGAMLDLALRVNFAERKGRGFVWSQRHGVWERLEWLTQFRPPTRVR